jgi:putative transposase
MKRSKFSDEQILAIVKEGEAGRKVADLCRAHGITEQTYYRWKAKYGGLPAWVPPPVGNRGTHAALACAQGPRKSHIRTQ